MDGFQDSLGYGEAGENLIARWMRSRGFAVLPIYEKIIDDGKGPRLYLPDNVVIAPDFFVFRGQTCLWIEAKHKTAFTWHRITRRFVTGIDLHHYDHYCLVDEATPWPVWLLFLHDGGQAKDSPSNTPAGLFGRKLSRLRQCENHRHANWGRHGMVYWSIQSLHKLAELTEVYALAIAS